MGHARDQRASEVPPDGALQRFAHRLEELGAPAASRGEIGERSLVVDLHAVDALRRQRGVVVVVEVRELPRRQMRVEADLPVEDGLRVVEAPELGRNLPGLVLRQLLGEDALPIAADRVPHQEGLDAEFALRHRDGLLQPAGEFRVGPEAGQRVASGRQRLRLLPAVVQNHQARRNARGLERVESAAHLVVVDRPVERVPGAPAELVDERRKLLAPPELRVGQTPRHGLGPLLGEQERVGAVRDVGAKPAGDGLVHVARFGIEVEGAVAPAEEVAFRRRRQRHHHRVGAVLVPDQQPGGLGGQRREVAPGGRPHPERRMRENVGRGEPLGGGRTSQGRVGPEGAFLRLGGQEDAVAGRIGLQREFVAAPREERPARMTENAVVESPVEHVRKIRNEWLRA